MKWFLALLFLNVSQVFSQKCCNEVTNNGSGFSSSTTPQLNSTDSFSICLWVRPYQMERFHVVTYINPEKEDMPFVITTAETNVSSNVVCSYAAVLKINESTHVCFTWSVTTGSNMYFNGSKLPTTNSSAINQPLNLTGTWYIGQTVTLDSPNSPKIPKVNGFVGSLCGVEIWREELTSEYINQIYVNAINITESSYNSDSSDKDSDAIINPLVTWAEFDHTDYESINATYCKPEKAHGIKLGNLDPVASKFVILFLVIVGVIIGFGALFMCSEREIANKRANKRLKLENHISLDEGSTNSMP